MVTSAENLPRALIGFRNDNVDAYYGEEDDGREQAVDPDQNHIIRPDVEIEMPDFIA